MEHPTTRLPVVRGTHPVPSPLLRRPRGSRRFYTPPQPPPLRPPREKTVSAVAFALILFLGVCAILLPVLRTVWGAVGGGITPRGIGRALGQMLLEGGLPPTDRPLWGGWLTEEATEPSSPPEDGTLFGPDTPSSQPSASAPDDLTVPLPSVTNEPSASAPAVTEPAEEEPGGSDPREDGETASEPPAESEPAEPAPPTAESSTEPEAPPPADPSTVPAGCVPVHTLDLSETARGAGYVIHSGGSLPATLPAAPFWKGAVPPVVLLVNTHPYEGYGDGGDWYDPATGGLAQVDSPSCPDGVVAMGSLLARALRDRGVTVIHLRVAVSAGETALSVYSRTQALIRYYCRLYPDIGLILDLRRGAEMTDAGGILRTEGRLNGALCAQLGITVSGGRDEEEVGVDLALALSLRRSLWRTEPTVSRPVEVKGGTGPAADEDGIRFLTLELGAAGNTANEARALLPLLAEALAHLLQDAQNYG